MRKHHYFQLALFFAYLFLATVLMIKQGIGITPDRYLIVLLVGVFLILHRLHRSIQFIHDFAPFVFILLAYDFLRGFADDLNPRVHYLPQIDLSKILLAGHVPTLELQHRFYTPGILHWYDYGAAYLYLLHFAMPLAFGFFLWFKNRKRFREFMLGLSLVSYGALIIYLIYPTAPPWLASKMGYIPHITKIFNVVLTKFPESWSFPTLYHFIGANRVAATPSLHAGYSFLIFLFALRYFGARGLVFFLYAFLMWVTIVYLGEHYYTDIIAGVAFDLVAFFLAIIISKSFPKVVEKL